MGFTAFLAYPESPGTIKQAIDTAVELSDDEELTLKPWEKMRSIGFKLDDHIRDEINGVDVLVADITYPNHNVLYEIGYAIALGKPIVYVEVLLKIREIALPIAKNDFELQERVRKVEEDFSLTESVVSGDFTSRLETAVQEVVARVKDSSSEKDLRQRLTNIMFENPISRLRETILSFQDQYSDILVLIDDLDKGWPPRRVEEHDVITIKHLIEVLNRIHRDLSRNKVTLRHLVFLRSDIYERLVEQTSDRGKYNVIKVDWSDADQLRHLLRQRICSDIDRDDQEAAWAAINPVVGTSDAVTKRDLYTCVTH